MSSYMSTIQPKKNKEKKVASSSKWQIIFAIYTINNINKLKIIIKFVYYNDPLTISIVFLELLYIYIYNFKKSM